MNKYVIEKLSRLVKIKFRDDREFNDVGKLQTVFLNDTYFKHDFGILVISRYHKAGYKQLLMLKLVCRLFEGNLDFFLRCI